MLSKCLFICLLSLTPHCIDAQDEPDFLAYADTKEGYFPCPRFIDDLIRRDPKPFVDLFWGKYSGPKLPIAVLEVDNTSRVDTFTYENDEGDEEKEVREATMVPIERISTMIGSTLLDTGRFQMLEREVLKELMDEQDRTRSGDAAAGPSGGKLVGARYAVKMVITEYEPGYKQRGFGLGGLGGKLGGSLSMSNKTSMVAVDFRLIDTETGEIVWSKDSRVEVSARSFGAGGGGGRKGKRGRASGFSFNKSPIGNAVRVAVNYCVFELVKHMGQIPVEAKVLGYYPEDDPEYVVVDSGDELVAPGDVLIAYTITSVFRDPDTGQIIERIREKVGTMTVERVTSRLCMAKPVDFDIDALSAGDPVRAPPRTASSPRFADEFEGKLRKYWNGNKAKREKRRKERNNRIRGGQGSEPGESTGGSPPPSEW